MATPSEPDVPGTPPLATVRYPELLGTRGLLALGVVFCHADVRPAFWLISFMDCFFVLSAFLITLGLLERRRGSVGQRMRSFYVRRVARIFPGYYTVLLGVAALLMGIQVLSRWIPLHPYPLTTLIPYVLYLQFVDLYGSTNELAIWDHSLRFLYHTWSLALEEQFYVIWGLLFFAARRPWMKVAVAAAFVAVGIASRASGLVVSPLLPYRLDAFGYGIAIALLVFHAPSLRLDPAALRRVARWSFGAFVFVLGNYLWGGGILQTYYDWWVHDRAIEYFQWTAMSILSSFASALLVLALVTGTGSRWARGLRARSVLYLGQISYALYLVHYPILDVLLYINTRILPFGHWGNAAVGIVLALGSAHGLTRFMVWAQDQILRRADPLPPRVAPAPIIDPAATTTDAAPVTHGHPNG